MIPIPRDIIRVRLSHEAIEGFPKRIDDNKDLFVNKSLDDIVMDALRYVDDHFGEFIDSGPAKKKPKKSPTEK